MKSKKNQTAFAKTLARTKRRLLFLKIRLFLLITLPIGIITIGHAVLKEYTKIKIRKAAQTAAPKSKKPDDAGE